VGVPEPLDTFGETVASSGMRTVRIAASIRELMMLTVVRDPADDVSLHGELSANREGVPDDGKGLKRPVREEPVVANGDPKAGDDIPHTEDHQLPHTHHPIPEQRDREPEADQRENDPDEIGHFPEDTQRRFFPH
jgi:hypothetical protein